jgi:hypothetical protein
MRFSNGALCRGALALSLVVSGGCSEKSNAHPVSEVPAADGLTETQRSRLKGEPLSELAFVPATVEGVVRVDLGSLAERDAQTAQALTFVFKAQQPVAAEILDRAGLRVGQELRSLYLVAGTHKEEILVAAAGKFDTSRLAEELGRRGERGEPMHGATVFHWNDPEAGRHGATDHGPDVELEPTSVALLPNLILVGQPGLVTAALETRAQKRKDVRTQPALVKELLAVDVTAALWGVGYTAASTTTGAQSWLPLLVPGVERARFHGALVDRGSGTLHLEAHFATPEQAQAFAKQLTSLLRTGALLAPSGTPLGKTLIRMKDSAKIDVEQKMVRAVSVL